MRRTHQVPTQNLLILRVRHDAFVPRFQQHLRVPHQKLLQRIVVRHKDRHRVPSPAPRPPRLLPKAARRPRIPVQNHRIQRPHVHAQLHRVRRAQAEQIPLKQRPLDLPPLFHRIACPVTLHPLRPNLPRRFQPRPRVLQHQLRTHARPVKRQGPLPRLRQLRQDLRGRNVRAQSPILAHFWRIKEHKRPLARRRPVSIHQLRPPSRQPLKQLHRIPNRRAAP